MAAAATRPRRFRKLLVVFGAMLALLLVIVLAIPFFIDVNRFRPLIQKTTQEALGRKVTLGRMELKLFPTAGIRIESPEVEGFVKARSLIVGARLLPLLSGRVELKQVILDGPEFSLTRDAKGRWDLPKTPQPSGAGPDTPEPQSFSLAALVVRDGRLRLSDAASPRRGKPLALEVPVDLSCSIARDAAGTVTAAGRLELSGLKLEGVPRPIDASARFDLVAKEDAQLLEVKHLGVEVGRSRIEIKGTVDNRHGGTRVDIIVPPATLAGDDLALLLALTGVAPGVVIEAKEPIHMNGSVKGEMSPRWNVAVAGEVLVAGISFRHPSMTRPLESVHGTLIVKSDGFEVKKFAATVGASDVSGSLSVKDLDAPQVRFDLSSKRADFMELMSIISPDPARNSGASGAPSGPSMLTRLRANGKLAIADGSFGTLRFSSLTSNLSFAKGVAQLDPTRMKLYGGTVEGVVTVDLGREPMACAVAVRPEGVDVAAMLAENLDLSDVLSGRLSGDLSITAEGSTRDAVLRSARGDGSIRIEKGRVGALNVLSILGRASDVLGEKSLKHVAEQLATSGTDFSSLTAGVQVADGKVTTSDFTLLSPDLELRDDGALDLIAGTIRMKGEILFSEALSQTMVDEGSKAVDYFWDSRRARVNLPLTLAGPVDDPTPGIDWGSAGGRLARRKVEEKLEERLGKAGLAGLLGDRGQRPGAQEAAPEVDAVAAPSTPGGPKVTIAESRYAGNFLVPDLRIKGTIAGASISSAVARAVDSKGRVVAEESLMDSVEAHYASHDRSQPATIAFRVELSGRSLAAAGRGVKVSIVIEDAEGRVTTQPVEARR